jgi:hypothetical protein
VEHDYLGNRWFVFLTSDAMHLVQILLPRADNSGNPFSKEDYDRVKEELARQFQGVTAYLRAPAEGLWKQGKESSRDDIVILEVMAKKIDLPDWTARRADLEKRFRQDEVIIRDMSIEVI